MSIPYKQFIHPVDKAAMESMRAVPGFDALCKKFSEYIDEKAFKICATASYIKLGPDQFPNIYNKLIPICDKLQIDVPELYLAPDGDTQAYAFGDTDIFIVLDAGLFWTFSEEEIETVLAVQCGHIVCRHTLYLTIARAIDQGMGDSTGPVSFVISKAIKGAVSYWTKCANFSADRVATYYFHDSKQVVDMCFKLAGAAPYVPGPRNIDLFIEQGKNYQETIKSSLMNKILTIFNPFKLDHPLVACRAYSATEFNNTFDYEEYEKSMRQENFKKITEGKDEQYNFELKFLYTKNTGIQGLASKIRNFMNNEKLSVNLQGVEFDVAPNGSWSKILNHGTYEIILKTHNRRAEYKLYLNSHTRLIVEWNDKDDMIEVKEEMIV